MDIKICLDLLKFEIVKIIISTEIDNLNVRVHLKLIDIHERKLIKTSQKRY